MSFVETCHTQFRHSRAKNFGGGNPTSQVLKSWTPACAGVTVLGDVFFSDFSACSG